MIPGNVVSAMMKAAGDGAVYSYTIDRSLRFNDGDSPEITMTPSVSGDRQKWTISLWIKRGALGVDQRVFMAGASTAHCTALRFDSSNRLWYSHVDGGSFTDSIVTSAVFRDPTAWLHLVVAVDTTQGTAADRVKIYVSGAQLTEFDTANYPALNMSTDVNTTNEHAIGNVSGAGAAHFDGYIAELHFIDGTAYEASDFGETDATTGTWKPKSPSVTYGTNGSYLSFADNTSTTTLGYDDAGGNDWTLVNITTADAVIDSPTNNFATINPLSSDMTPENGNLYVPSLGWYSAGVSGFQPLKTGRWYVETLVGPRNGSYGAQGWGSAKSSHNNTPEDFGESVYHGALALGGQSYALGCHFNGGDVGYKATDLGTITEPDATTLYSANELWIVHLLDLDTNEYWIGTAFVGDASPTWFPGDPSSVAGWDISAAMNEFDEGVVFVHAPNATSANVYAHVNFGQKAWKFTPPTNALSVSTANLPEPSIKNPTAYFNAVAYTGDGTAIGSGGLAVTGVGHQPDLVWIKNRDAADQHVLTDSVRGATKYLSSDGTDVEATAAETLDSFDSDGFTVGSDVQVNTNTEDYIAWCWKEGATPGFDIVSYTGNGASGATVAHALGVAPEMMIIKNRDQADSWAVYHKDNTSAPETDYLILNTTAATADDNTLWNDTAPTDASFTLGTNHQVNADTEDYIAYLWASVDGFSKVGNYTGSGASPKVVYCGFRPRWIMFKRTDTTGSWYIYDTVRGTANEVDDQLLADDTAAETTGSEEIDITATGFVHRSTDAGANASGGTYVFVAFAEAPFKYANAA